MSRISLSAYKMNRAATAAPAPERRLGFGESASTREARVHESQLEGQLLDRLEGLLKQCGNDPASSQAIKDWFCVEGIKGHAKKGLIRVLVYIRVWSAVLRGEGVDVEGQNMDKAENRARQAFGACISAITAVNGVVYKLTAGSEKKEHSTPQAEVVKAITGVLPSLVEAMAGPGEKPRPRGFHPNELSKLKTMMASWRKRGVLPPPVLHDAEQLLMRLEYTPAAVKENGDATVGNTTSAETTRHAKHIAWVLTTNTKRSEGIQNHASPTAGVGVSPPRSVSRTGSPPGLVTEVDRKASMQSALQELFANHVKPEEWWGSAFEAKGVFRNGPEGHWSIHLSRAREEAHQRRKQGRGLLGANERHNDPAQDDIEREVAAGDRKVASKHERKVPKYGRDRGRDAKRSTGREARVDGTSGSRVKSETAAEDSDAHMEVDEDSANSDSMPSTPSTVPSEASPSPEPELETEPEPAPEPEPTSPLPATVPTANSVAAAGAEPASAANAVVKSETEEGKPGSGAKSESTAGREDKDRQGIDSESEKRPRSPPRVISKREQEEAERQRRKEELRRAGKERGKLREAEKLRQRQEKERQREHAMAEIKRKKALEKAESEQLLKEARERAAELLKQEEERARSLQTQERARERGRYVQPAATRETEEEDRRRAKRNGERDRESDRPRDGGRRDRDKGREDRVKEVKETERTDAREREERHSRDELGGNDHGERERVVEDRENDGHRERERDPTWRIEQPLPGAENRKLNSRERKVEKAERKRRRSDPEAVDGDRGGLGIKERRDAKIDDEHDLDHRSRKKRSKKEKRDRKDHRHEDPRYGGARQEGSEDHESRGRKRSRDSSRVDTVDHAQSRDDGASALRIGRSRDSPGLRAETSRRELDSYRPSSGPDLLSASASGTERREAPRQSPGNLSAPGRGPNEPSTADGTAASRPRAGSPSRGPSDERGKRGGSVDRGKGKDAGRGSRERRSAAGSPNAGGVTTGAGLPGMDVYGSPPSDIDLLNLESHRGVSGRAGSEDMDHQGKRSRRDSRGDRRGLDVYGPSVGNDESSESRRRKDGERDGGRRQQRSGPSPGKHGGLAALAMYGPSKEGEARGGRGTERDRDRPDRRSSSRSRDRAVRDSGRRRGDLDGDLRHAKSSILRGNLRSIDRPPPPNRDGPPRWRPSSPHGSFDSRDGEWGRPGLPGPMAPGAVRYPPPPGISMAPMNVGMPPYDHGGLGRGAGPPLGVHPTPPLGMHPGIPMGDGRHERHSNLAEREEREEHRRRADREERRRRSDEDRWRGGADNGRRRDSHGGIRRSPPRSAVEPPVEEEPEEGELVIETKSNPIAPMLSAKLRTPRPNRWGNACDVSTAAVAEGNAAVVKTGLTESSSSTGEAGSKPSQEVVSRRAGTPQAPASENGQGAEGGHGEGFEAGEVDTAHSKQLSVVDREGKGSTTTQKQADTRVGTSDGNREFSLSEDRRGGEEAGVKTTSDDGTDLAQSSLPDEVKSKPSSGPHAVNDLGVEVAEKPQESTEATAAQSETVSKHQAVSHGSAISSQAKPLSLAVKANAKMSGVEPAEKAAVAAKIEPSVDGGVSSTNAPLGGSMPGQACAGKAPNGGGRRDDAGDDNATKPQETRPLDTTQTVGAVLPTREDEPAALAEPASPNPSDPTTPPASRHAPKNDKPTDSKCQTSADETTSDVAASTAAMKELDEGGRTAAGGTSNGREKEPELQANQQREPGSERSGSNGLDADVTPAFSNIIVNQAGANTSETPSRRSTGGDRSNLMSFVRKAQDRKPETPYSSVGAGGAARGSSPCSLRITAPRPHGDSTADMPAGSDTPPVVKSPHGNVFSRLGPPRLQTGGDAAGNGSPSKDGGGAEGGTCDGKGGGAAGGGSSGIVTWGPQRKRVAKDEKAVRPGGLIGRAFQDHLKTPRKSGGGERRKGPGDDGGGGDQ